jgi:hypothetical protein
LHRESSEAPVVRSAIRLVVLLYQHGLMQGGETIDDDLLVAVASFEGFRERNLRVIRHAEAVTADAQTLVSALKQLISEGNV